MTRMTGPDCVVMCNLINTHTHNTLLMSWRGANLFTISRFFVPIFLFGQNVAVALEGVGFRPRAVVAERGVVAVCTRISSQEHIHDK